MPLTFDPDGHRYAIDGTPAPSVTKILKDLGIVDARFYKPEHSLRGHVAHDLVAKICKVVADGYEWDRTCNTPDYLGYGVACQGFLDAYGIIPEKDGIEKAVFHPTLRYAGRIDLLGNIPISSERWIVDFKTGPILYSAYLQVGAYGLIERADKMAIVRLHKTGMFGVEYATKRHQQEFISCLNTWRILEKLGRVTA
jgi:hypothetical protein